MMVFVKQPLAQSRFAKYKESTRKVQGKYQASNGKELFPHLIPLLKVSFPLLLLLLLPLLLLLLLPLLLLLLLAPPESP